MSFGEKRDRVCVCVCVGVGGEAADIWRGKKRTYMNYSRPSGRYYEPTRMEGLVKKNLRLCLSVWMTDRPISFRYMPDGRIPSFSFSLFLFRFRCIPRIPPVRKMKK